MVNKKRFTLTTSTVVQYDI